MKEERTRQSGASNGRDEARFVGFLQTQQIQQRTIRDAKAESEGVKPTKKEEEALHVWWERRAVA